MSELRLATVRHIGPYTQIPLAFECLGQLLGAAAPSLRNVAPTMIAIYHDDPEVMLRHRLAVCAAVVGPRADDRTRALRRTGASLATASMRPSCRAP